MPGRARPRSPGLRAPPRGSTPLLAVHHRCGVMSVSDASLRGMRTTVNLDPDVAAAAEQLRRSRHIGLSEAVNELARSGMRSRPQRQPFRQRILDLGLTIDVSNVAETLEYMDQEDRPDDH